VVVTASMLTSSPAHGHPPPTLPLPTAHRFGAPGGRSQPLLNFAEPVHRHAVDASSMAIPAHPPSKMMVSGRHGPRGGVILLILQTWGTSLEVKKDERRRDRGMKMMSLCRRWSRRIV
jgi:hypothetical protein